MNITWLKSEIVWKESRDNTQTHSMIVSLKDKTEMLGKNPEKWINQTKPNQTILTFRSSTYRSWSVSESGCTRGNTRSRNVNAKWIVIMTMTKNSAYQLLCRNSEVNFETRKSILYKSQVWNSKEKEKVGYPGWYGWQVRGQVRRQAGWMRIVLRRRGEHFGLYISYINIFLSCCVRVGRFRALLVYLCIHLGEWEYRVCKYGPLKKLQFRPK